MDFTFHCQCGEEVRGSLEVHEQEGRDPWTDVHVEPCQSCMTREFNEGREFEARMSSR